MGKIELNESIPNLVTELSLVVTRYNIWQGVIKWHYAPLPTPEVAPASTEGRGQADKGCQKGEWHIILPIHM